MKQILHCLLICFLSLAACTGNTNNSTTKKGEENTWILGKWEDKNSVIEYRSDGTFIGTWNGKIKKEGTWKITGEQILKSLEMRFNDRLAASYTIISKSENEFKIQSQGDNAIFVKTRQQ